MTSEQLTAARGLARLTIAELAEFAQLSARQIIRLESEPGEIKARQSTLDAIEAALLSKGVIFIEADENSGPGVRLVKEDK